MFPEHGSEQRDRDPTLIELIFHYWRKMVIKRCTDKIRGMILAAVVREGSDNNCYLSHMATGPGTEWRAPFTQLIECSQ